MSTEADQFGLAPDWRLEDDGHGRRIQVRNRDGYLLDVSVRKEHACSVRNRRAAEEVARLPETLEEREILRAEIARYRECFEVLVGHSDWALDIDGADFQDALEEHGVFVKVPADEMECADYDMEFGHPLSVVYVLAWSERAKAHAEGGEG